MDQTQPRQVFEQEKTVKSWDDDYYHPIALKYYDRAVPEMLRIMAPEPGATILDAGCGPGVHSIRVAREGFKVRAIDISETMLGEARERVRQAGLADSVEFSREDLTALSFPDASFRYVFSWGVIIHIRNIEAALDELARIVEPGGKLALYLTNKSGLDHKFESALRAVIRKPLKGMERLPMGDGIYYDMHGEKLWVWRVDADALTDYLKPKGFRRIHHGLGELTEVQRRVTGFPRRMLLRLNNLAYGLKLSPNMGVGNLFVFEKGR